MEKATKSQGNDCIVDIMQDMERDQKTLSNLFYKINPELHKIITDPKNQDQFSFNLIKDYCEKAENYEIM